MTNQTVPLTAPEVIREAAKLIGEHGWLASASTGKAPQIGPCGLNLTQAVCWAVHKQPCRAIDLSELESVHVAEVLDHLEEGLDMSIISYERRHATDTPRVVGQELRAIAWALGAILDPPDWT
jgi:hypothetical protein